MKKKIWGLLALVAAFSGCNNNGDIIYDYAPVSALIEVHNDEGQDLLDPHAEGNLKDQGMTVTYKGQTLPIDTVALPMTRYFMPTDYVPYLDEYQGRWRLHIGDWDAARQWKEEPITLNWPDGTQSHITFTLKKAGLTHAKWRVDGVSHQGGFFQFTYPIK